MPSRFPNYFRDKENAAPSFNQMIMNILVNEINGKLSRRGIAGVRR